MAHIQYVDSLVREYMLFRGFAGTLKAFDTELKTDKDKGFRVDKIIEHITHAINVHDLAVVRDIWSHLDGHLFTKLEHSFTSAVRKLESGILKLYLVTAFAAAKSDKITEFFTKLAPELHSQSEWKDWFFFPFCKNPEENPVFAVCFTKQWQDTLLISLHNFLATIFQCMPQPTLTRADTEASLVRQLHDENAALRARLLALSGAAAPTTTTSSHHCDAATTTTTTSATASASSAASTPSHHQQQHNSTAAANATTTTHQSRLSSFHKQSAAATATAAAASSSAVLASSPAGAGHDQPHGGSQRSPRTASQQPASHQQQSTHITSDHIVPFDVPPPTHIVDDFYIIAMETQQHGQLADGQARGLRSLIKNIGSGGAGSPVLGRKESQDRQKRRAGSTGSGRSWTTALH